MQHSPVHSYLESLGPQWGQIEGSPVALRFGAPEPEAAAMRQLALCDVSSLGKMVVKGPAASSWLGEQGVEVPPEIYETRGLPDGGLVARTGTDEYFLESGIAGQFVPALRDQVGPAPAGVYRIERQDATFLLSGSRAHEVMAQTCGVNLKEAAPERLVLTSVAGVTCGVLPDPEKDVRIYRLWADFTYAFYLWETLHQIVDELGGQIVGVAAFYPDLAGA